MIHQTVCIIIINVLNCHRWKFVIGYFFNTNHIENAHASGQNDRKKRRVK